MLRNVRINWCFVDYEPSKKPLSVRVEVVPVDTRFRARVYDLLRCPETARVIHYEPAEKTTAEELATRAAEEYVRVVREREAK